MSDSVSTAEAARMIGVKAHTLRVWRCQGRGPKYCRLSPRGRAVYRRCDVESWIATRTFSSTAEETVEAASSGS